ncbi:TetR family transcriptional regulator [Nocardia sp. ET3-3]|uniref:TetR family transcriptional regulator n=1 Tax=Nocardia terrae TaxID=2675851 RepID=A0A7K1V279_9NOCA|nr:TetR family transcriptional regulator [Nocardia terrae]
MARQRPRKHDGRGSTELAVFSATTHLLRETPLQDLTVAQILARARVSRANFYHYFASKYDVITAMVERLVEDTHSTEGPWHAELGESHRQAMEDNLRHTIDLWSSQSELICAVVEHMHVVPQLASAWNLMLDRFISEMTTQLDQARAGGDAPDGAPAAMIAAILVSGYERCFYVGARAYDSHLPNPEAAVDSIVELTLAALYGNRRTLQHQRKKRRTSGKLPDTVLSAAAAVGSSPDASEAPEFETAATIIEATNSLLQEMPFEQVSVAKILERAKLSRATFYFYFANKDDVFLALFDRVAGQIVSRFSTLAQVDRSNPDRVRSAIIHWLDLDPNSLGVLRAAIHEWTRRPDLRERYLAIMTSLIASLATAIESDRAAGLALDGPPAPQFAAVLLWTVERSIAGSLAGERNLEQTPAVATYLGELLTSTIYGK